MYPARYYPNRYWVSRYWPKSSEPAEPVETTTTGRAVKVAILSHKRLKLVACEVASSGTKLAVYKAGSVAIGTYN